MQNHKQQKKHGQMHDHKQQKSMVKYKIINSKKNHSQIQNHKQQKKHGQIQDHKQQKKAWSNARS